jgi:hypothetical protein
MGTFNDHQRTLEREKVEPARSESAGGDGDIQTNAWLSHAHDAVVVAL